MSQAGILSSTGGGSSTVMQVDTDNGTAIPAGGILNIVAQPTPNQHAGSSVSFSGSGNTVLFNVTDAGLNTIIGLDCGNATMNGQSNTMLGVSCGTLITNGSRNVAIGNGALPSITSGSSNVIIGCSAGDFYTGNETSNILIGDDVNGINGESNVLRIGSGTGAGTGQLTQAFICGIDGVNVGPVATVVTESLDQLGTAVITAGTGINVTAGANTITIAAAGVVTLSYTSVNSSPYVVLTSDDFISVDCSGGAITVQLPNAATLGRTYVIKDRTGSAGTNNITVTTVGGAINIDGATTFVMNTAYQAVSIIGNGFTYELY